VFTIIKIIAFIHLYISQLRPQQVLKQVSGAISWSSPDQFGPAVVEFICAQEKEVVDGVQRNFQQVSVAASFCFCFPMPCCFCFYQGFFPTGGRVLQRPSPQAAKDQARIQLAGKRLQPVCCCMLPSDPTTCGFLHSFLVFCPHSPV
jgi:hypothetical protein